MELKIRTFSSFVLWYGHATRPRTANRWNQISKMLFPSSNYFEKDLLIY